MLVILVASALVGLKVLSIFGISLDVFRVVGGMIIAYMGFDMLRGNHTVAQAPPEKSETDVSHSLVPLLMFAAGPGTITAVVTLAAVQCHWHRCNICGVDACCSAWTSSGPRHASNSYALYGARRSFNGNAIRAGRPKGIPTGVDSPTPGHSQHFLCRNTCGSLVAG